MQIIGPDAAGRTSAAAAAGTTAYELLARIAPRRGDVVVRAASGARPSSRPGSTAATACFEQVDAVGLAVAPRR